MTNPAMSRAEAIEKAAVALDSIYARIWDRVDGALVLFPDSIPRFEEASRQLKEALAIPKEDGVFVPRDVLQNFWKTLVGVDLSDQGKSIADIGWVAHECRLLAAPSALKETNP